MTHSPEEIQRRRRFLSEGFEKKTPFKTLAADLGYSHQSGLTLWMKRHAQDLREKFNTEPRYRSGNKPLPREEAVKRLRAILTVELMGFNIVNLAAWARSNAPDGAAQALEDYGETP